MATSKNFTDRELRCKHCKKNEVPKDVLRKLEKMRRILGQPVRLNSAYRCPEHNAAVSGTGRRGPHTTGRAFDVRARSSAHAIDIVEAALKAGFCGIGVYVSGRAKRIHIDDLKKRMWQG